MSVVVSFQYCRISDEFIAQLCRDVCSKQSVVLVGPRYSGKRYVLARLAELLKEQRIQPVEIQLLSESRAPGGAGLPCSLEHALEAENEHPVILAANVDALERQVAGDFLKILRQGSWTSGGPPCSPASAI